MTDSIYRSLIKRKSKADKLIRKQLLEIDDGLATFPVINGGSDYRIANFLSKFLAGVSVGLASLGLIGIVIGLIGWQFQLILGGLAFLLTGIVNAALWQLALAITDTADNVRTIASVLQQHLYTQNITKNGPDDEATSEVPEKIST